MKKIILLTVLAGILGLFTACSMEHIKELEFTVVEEDEIPEELMEKIEDAKKEKMRITFADKGYLYIVEGYGVQKTSGYSIEVEELYETENSIHITTTLLGPDKSEEIIEKETYPFVVVKTEENEKYVVFTD